MKSKKPDDEELRPRLEKETLRGLGFEELAEVHGGRNGHPRPIASRYCVG